MAQPHTNTVCFLTLYYGDAWQLLIPLHHSHIINHTAIWYGNAMYFVNFHTIPISSRLTGDLIWEWYGYPWFLLHSNAIWKIEIQVCGVRSHHLHFLFLEQKQLGSQIYIHLISLIHLKLCNSHLQLMYNYTLYVLSWQFITKLQ